MVEPKLRLGDMIDDYCPRCRLLLNHRVASLVDGNVAKVICQTCYSEHPYRRGEGGKKKKPPRGRAALFDAVLSKTAAPPDPSPGPAEAEPPPPPKKKKTAMLARYISRHKTKPPRGGK